jgi:hypothetical protein
MSYLYFHTYLLKDLDKLLELNDKYTLKIDYLVIYDLSILDKILDINFEKIYYDDNTYFNTYIHNKQDFINIYT